MRFVVKWNNGTWKVFDTVSYSDVATPGLKSHADLLAAEFNSRASR